MKCMCAQTRPRFILSSERVFGGMEFEPMLNPREKSPLRKMSPEEDRTRDAVDSEPKYCQLSYSGPQIPSDISLGVTEQLSGQYSRGTDDSPPLINPSVAAILSILNVCIRQQVWSWRIRARAKRSEVM